ncbi:MAG TPA: hypothetical protein VFZ69_06875 [Longimicrobiales bacterium]
MMQGRLPIAAALCAAVLAAAPTQVRAQRTARGQAAQSQLMSELGRLRQAAALEAAGNYAEAERIVGEVLRSNPGSLSGLLAMERLLTQQARLPGILPLVDRLLEADPSSVVGHQTRLRVAAELNDVTRLEAAIAEWIRITPDLETPYREAALIWRRRGETERAIALLERGRTRIDRPDALALELGDAFASAQDPTRAAEHWARAIGPQGRGFLLVQRRLQGLPDGGARIIPSLVDRLGAEPFTFDRLRAAALLAIDAGLERPALRIIAALEGVAPAAEREPLMVELARRADGSGLHTVALRLYQDLVRAAADPAATLALRTRMAELALLAGDTALAADTYRQLEHAAAAGSPQRRQAIALRIQLTAREGDLDAAATDFDAFRAEFPQGPELDATAAALAEALLDRGNAALAARVLAGVTGARAAQLRGLIHLRNGDIELARHELLSAAPLLRGSAATSTIALATLLARVSARGGELVAHLVTAPDADRPAQVRDAAERARALPADDRAAVLDFLAEAADAAGAADDADALRREIIETLPQTHEAPAALLALARGAAADPESEEEARVLLEKLIVEYPRSTLAPQARTELQRIQQH